MKLRWILNGLVQTVASGALLVSATPLGDIALSSIGIPPVAKPYIIGSLASLAGGTGLLTAVVQGLKQVPSTGHPAVKPNGYRA